MKGSGFPGLAEEGPFFVVCNECLTFFGPSVFSFLKIWSHLAEQFSVLLGSSRGMHFNGILLSYTPAWSYCSCSLGDPGVHEMGIPSRNGDPQQHIWKALSHRRQVLPRPCWAPGGFPAILATTGSTTGTDPPPTVSGISTCAAQVYPTLAALPACFLPQWPSLRAQLGSPPLPPPGADTRPVPPGFASPLPRSRGAAHLHQWLSVSPVPTPGSRSGSRTSLLPPGQT